MSFLTGPQERIYSRSSNYSSSMSNFKLNINPSAYATTFAFSQGSLARVPAYQSLKNPDSSFRKVVSNETLSNSDDYWNPSKIGTNLPLLQESNLDVRESQNSIEENSLNVLGRSEFPEKYLDKGLEAFENVATENFSLPSVIGGSVISAISSGINSYENQNNLNIATQGNGPNGHSFEAINNAQAQNNVNNVYSDIRTGLITGGSLLGPEGLVAGTALAALTVIPQSLGVGAPDQNIVNSSSGAMVNPASTF